MEKVGTIGLIDVYADKVTGQIVLRVLTGTDEVRLTEKEALDLRLLLQDADIKLEED